MLLLLLNLVSLIVGYNYLRKEETPDFGRITSRILLGNVACVMIWVVTLNPPKWERVSIWLTQMPPINHSEFEYIIGFLITYTILGALIVVLLFMVTMFIPYVILYILNNFKWKKKIIFKLSWFHPNPTKAPACPQAGLFLRFLMNSFSWVFSFDYFFTFSIIHKPRPRGGVFYPLIFLIMRKLFHTVRLWWTIHFEWRLTNIRSVKPPKTR